MRLRVAIPLILIATAAVTAFASCAKAGAADAPSGAPALAVTQVGDTLRVIAAWRPACDARGCPDSTRVTWTVRGAARPARHTRGTSDTLWLPAPAWGDSAVVLVGVTALRRGLPSPTRSATTVLRRQDSPPPAVDSLKVDTLRHAARADSTRLTLYAADGTPFAPGTARVRQGDSVLAVMRLYLRAGEVRTAADTISWGTRNLSATVALRTPRGRWRDSVWVIALDCQCQESGDRQNPPVLELRSGRYRVRSSASVDGWRDVTPVSANPYAVGVR